MKWVLSTVYIVLNLLIYFKGKIMLYKVTSTNKQDVVSFHSSLPIGSEDELVKHLVASILAEPKTQGQIHTNEHQLKNIKKFTIVVDGEKNEILEIKMDDILEKIRNKVPKS